MKRNRLFKLEITIVYVFFFTLQIILVVEYHFYHYQVNSACDNQYLNKTVVTLVKLS